MKTMSKVVTLLVLGALCSAPTWVRADEAPAQDTPPAQGEQGKDGDKKDDEKKDNWQPPQPAQWPNLH